MKKRDNVFECTNRGASTFSVMGIIAVLVVVIGVVIAHYTRLSQPNRQTESQVTEKNQEATTPKDETASWELFVDDKVGYSLRYPPELKAKHVSEGGLGGSIARIILPLVHAAGLQPNTWGFKSDFLVLDITREKISDISDAEDYPMGRGAWLSYPNKKALLQDEENLKNGQFGHAGFFAVGESQRVVKVDNEIYGKEFTSLAQVDACSVLPTRVIVFFKNGYMVTIVLQAWAVDKIESELPQYFTLDKKECSDDLMWNWKLKPDGSVQFYYDLANGKISPETEAGIWYNTFDKIISTIDLSLVENGG